MIDANGNRQYSTFFDIRPGAIKPPAVLFVAVNGITVTRHISGPFWAGNIRVTDDKFF